MAIAVSADDADRTFSGLLRGAPDGHTDIVSRQGRAVAALAPVTKTPLADPKAAFREFLGELERRPAQNPPKLTRDDMHDRA